MKLKLARGPDSPKHAVAQPGAGPETTTVTTPPGAGGGVPSLHQYGGAMYFLVATAGFAIFVAIQDPRQVVLVWGAALVIAAAARTVIVSRLGVARKLHESICARGHIALSGLIGGICGIAPFLLPAGGDDSWRLAIDSLWLLALAFAAFVSQPSASASGAAFALPALAPLSLRLLSSGEANLTAVGLANIFLCVCLYLSVRQTRAALLEEARHRATFERLARYNDAECRRGKHLVHELRAEIERRKYAEIALRSARDTAEAISNQDHLTGLANRRAFDRVLAFEWTRLLQTARPLSLVICEIDLFRSYNEHYGSIACDQCLVMISSVVADTVKRVGGSVSRYGNEQFYILLSDTAERRALDLAESVRQSIHDLTILHRGAAFDRIVTASFGVATLVAARAHREHELIEAADHALCRAKRGGGNCVFAVYGDIANDDY